MKTPLHTSSGVWPTLVSGFGVFLGLLLVGEAVVVWLELVPPPQTFYIGALTSAPFIVGFVYGGRSLAASELPAERYDRIVRWWLAGMAVTVPTAIFVISTAFRPITAKMAVGAVRWSLAIGGGVGLLLGVFQARAIQRTIEATEARQRKERVERERDRLDEFAGTVAHDLQNPLHVAMGRLELAQIECDSDHLDDVARAHDQMSALIENLLVLAREESPVEETAYVDLGPVVEECWAAIETEQSTLVIEARGSVRADRTRLRQLFENLFQNAIERGGPDVTVTVGHLADGFYVADDGPGVPADELAAVLDQPYPAAETGAGFSLSVVTVIVDAHGWDLDLPENGDRGTRFEITGVETG